MDVSINPPGIPWLTQPVKLHSGRSGAHTCSSDLTPEQCAYQHYRWRNWFLADLVYSLPTVWFLVAVVGVFAVGHCFLRYAPVKLKRNVLWRRTEAGVRYLAYRGYKVGWSWTPALGVMLLIGVGVIFFLAMTLGPMPYYWPNTDKVNYGNSPPIATQAGYMALALLPFVMALSAKANLISALTGVPHEKLQIFHHWTGYAMFVLALVHTFPFIVYHRQQGDMVKQWNTSMTYWTGVAALVPQGYLTLMSFPSIRNRFYEFFKATHFLAALVFVLLFFFHCDFILTSWDYFIATGAIYLFSLAVALINTYIRHGLHTATIDRLPCGLIRVKIPTRMSWKAGQHVFVRFFPLGLHSLTAHPFTLSSLPCTNPPVSNGKEDVEGKNNGSETIFYIKPRRGITARLAALADKSPGCTKKLFLEGPYGGLNTSLERFDETVLIAGGSGGGFSLGVVEETLRVQKPAGDDAKRALNVVFATRDTKTANWYTKEVDALASTYSPAGFVWRSIHVTSHHSAELSGSTDIDIEKSAIPTSGIEVPDSSSDQPATPDTSKYHLRRPDIPAIISRIAKNKSNTGEEMGSERRKRIGIIACGPASMLHDTRNAAADAQRAVARGNVEEVYLHMEPFAW